MFDRFDRSTEAAILGCILKDGELLLEICDSLEYSDFYDTRHMNIYRLMIEMVKSDKKIDIVTLSQAANEKNLLHDIGGVTYLSELTNSNFKVASIETYVKTVKDKSVKRKVLSMMAKLQEGSDNKTGQELVLEIEGVLEKLVTANKHDLCSMQQILEVVVEKIGALSISDKKLLGIPTGLNSLDRVTSGLIKQDYIVIAARPSMGKTTFATTITENVSKDNVVAFFSLEMSKEQLAQKMLASKSRIDYGDMRVGKIKEDQWEALGIATNKLSLNRLYIDDTAAQTLNEMRSKCRKLKMQQGQLDVVIVDYLQLVEGKGESRQQIVSDISRGMKKLAKDLDTTVIVLSQLSRTPEQRADHRPMLSDLRESGSIEQDADIVIFLYRDEYYNAETEDKGILEAIIAKQRNGEVGTVKLAWLGSIQKVADLALHTEISEKCTIFDK